MDGADENGKNAPKATDIVHMPQSDYGGKDGYNLATNPLLLISNT
ncbi:hypothetical protein EVA_15431, partial [gut metagenome]